MSWFWLNVPLPALFFAAWSGIPLCMILRRGPAAAGQVPAAPRSWVALTVHAPSRETPASAP
jgi:hypothetical protein